jgi:uncharacterized protein YbaA (DUF1428 family)
MMSATPAASTDPRRRETMLYVDGFLLPVPKGNLDAYRAMAQKASAIWKDHGALEYRECVMDDAGAGTEGSENFCLSFDKAADARPDETVIFAYITYRSREHRDEVNKKVMADKRIEAMMEGGEMPFDCKRMFYGGFRTIVQA